VKAAIYSRKSKFTGKGESVENQVQLCKEYLNQLQVNDFTIYEDEGFSGSNTDRPQFQQMLKDAKSKKFDIIICYRLDRISRNIADFSSLIEELQNNISFISIREQFDSLLQWQSVVVYSIVFAHLKEKPMRKELKITLLELLSLVVAGVKHR
jgi:DNA invertase Pin-like site-specific DNA recombinase